MILDSSIWLALMIGNSRLHWAWFMGENLQAAWDTQHLPASFVQQLANCRTLTDFPVELLPSQLVAHRSIQDSSRLSPLASCPLPLYLASVVPSQTKLWLAYPDVHLITLDQIPLQGAYSTLGIDRALALWGAEEAWGFPSLVIDAGTALTFTGADANCRLVGGAILPGLGLQLQSLAQKTAIPLVEAPISLPQRWAVNTPEAIQSGVIYTIIAGMRAFIAAWWQEFPDSCITLTGGDRTLLLAYLQSHFPEVGSRVITEPDLIFWGMRSFWALQQLR